ncbi:MAG: hypothetical protein P1U87_03415 [Verrucomicrobiales bacterium]|nr:hypothetical protein [Verrucomicrobiales bacterium]
MIKETRNLLVVLLPLLLLCACVEPTDSSSTSGTSSGSALNANPTVPQERLTKHDAALRFLTAYIRLDRPMALRYADAKAVSKLDWNVPHRGNIPYYDDKMLLQFHGGWARVYFQEIDGSFRVSDLEVHRR